MNKALVEKLAVQSLVWVDTGLADGREQIFSTQKFAELIVEECAQQCWTVSELESKGFVVSECAKKIRKHFGVTE
jgi:hypothetical protein